ncbi:receptor-like protein 35 [Prosopis cineraria]|uniref:receptor-like protein 35 n=1 Tax=Prosopis cineraria TaxID=364024 RepID=UPI00240F6CFB|nr:receptor-like protein 35 [Prosopis cineraria]
MKFNTEQGREELGLHHNAVVWADITAMASGTPILINSMLNRKKKEVARSNDLKLLSNESLLLSDEKRSSDNTHNRETNRGEGAKNRREGEYHRFSVRDPYSHLDYWSNSSSIRNWVGVTCDSNYGTVRILDLSETSLKGTLSSKIGNLSFLVKLNLHRNNFYALQHLILNNNGFEGLIPPSISNLSKLKSLECKSNFIKGSIPFEIGRLESLKILRVSSNNLSGIIPPISNLSLLEQIMLSYNSLSGYIPKTIGALTNLKIIYLGVNKLSGQIPRNIENLAKLHELELGENNIEELGTC